jgi:hypothetical protein
LADRFEVAARLAEGQPAVEHTQTYVQACHALGYQHSDLTARGTQVHDWYDSESGLDLRALDDDSAQLRAAATTLDEALWQQRMQITEIAAAWTGLGADAAMRFLQCHCDTAAQVAAHAHAAADGYAALRDNLWQLVDRKAATAVEIDERTAGERSAWLAAAHTVTAGAGDRSAAEEVIRQQVIPYVDNDIGHDWLTAMRSIAAAVEASYDAAIDAISWPNETCFEIPGELAPHRGPVVEEQTSPVMATVPDMPARADIAPTVPAAVSAPLPAPPSTPPAQPLPTPPAQPLPTPADLTAPLGDAAGLSTGAGDLGSIGGLGGSIGGVIGKIVDGIGALLGSLVDGLAEPSGSEDPLSDDALDSDDPLDTDDADDTDEDNDDADDESPDAAPADADTTGEDANSEAHAENPSEPSDPTEEAIGQPVTPPSTPPPDAPPPSPPEPLSDGSTPCEIAAEELPQAGQ